MNKNTLLLPLTLALLLPLIASCGDTPQTAGTSTEALNNNAAADTDATGTEEAGEPRIPSALPEMSLDGYTMNFLSRFSEGGDFVETGIYANELNGEAVNDAVYERNHSVMDKYNFKIEYTDIGDHDVVMSTIKKTVAAGDDVFQSVLYGAVHLASFAPSNYLLDLNSLDYLALDQPWWSGKMNEEISVGGRLYMSLNAFMFNAKTNLYHIIFNKQLAAEADYNASDLYDMARNGTWTIDRYAEFIKSAKKDLNGDGAFDDNDLWGCQCETYTAYAVATGMDVRFIGKDADDIPYISVEDERNLSGILRTLDFYADRDHILVTENIKGVPDIWQRSFDMMVEGKALSTIFSLRPFLRDMETDYGVLPMPKYSEDQEYYRHITTVYNAPVFSLLSTNKEPDKAAFVSEALAYESYYATLPVFYDNFLHTKMARDPESVEMLRIIHDSVTFELSSLYILDRFISQMNSAAKDGSTKYASRVASAVPGATKQLDKVVASILDN